jgi:rapamycin-insensitive companion of mTOR
VLSRRALGELTSLNGRKPELFRSVKNFQKTLHIFECHNIRLPARRSIIDMFDKGVVRRIVLDEEGSESEHDYSDEGEGEDDDSGAETQPNTARPSVSE